MSGILRRPSFSPPPPPPPPCEVIDLVASKLDPKTLAIASCVSKSWSILMSADHLWQPICIAHFPAVSNLHHPLVVSSYRRIYSLGQSALRRRLQPPPKPHLSLHNILFVISIKSQQHSTKIPNTTTIVKPCSELEIDEEFGLFRFSFDLDPEVEIMDEEEEDVKVTWNVVLLKDDDDEYEEGILTVLDWRGKGRSRDWWLTEELPSGGCCFSGRASGTGLVVEMKLGVRRVPQEKMKKKKVVVLYMVRVGIMSLTSWRYASIDDALRYFQHYLLP